MLWSFPWLAVTALFCLCRHQSPVGFGVLARGALSPIAYGQTGEQGWFGGGGYTLTSFHEPLDVPGAKNVFSGRKGAVSWTAAGGNLWLSGGHDFASAGTKGELTDLWKFNPSTRELPWMGSRTVTAIPLRLARRSWQRSEFPCWKCIGGHTLLWTTLQSDPGA